MSFYYKDETISEIETKILESILPLLKEDYKKSVKLSEYCFDRDELGNQIEVIKLELRVRAAENLLDYLTPLDTF